VSAPASREKLTGLLFASEGWRFDLTERALGSGKNRRRFDTFGIADAMAFRGGEVALVQITDFTNWAVHVHAIEEWVERDYATGNPWLTHVRVLYLIGWKPKTTEYKRQMWSLRGRGPLHRAKFSLPPKTKTTDADPSDPSP
jgi:hypothetical protein